MKSKRRLVIVLLVLLASGVWVLSFVLQSSPAWSREAAIGDVPTLDPHLRRAFDPADFRPMLPGESAWLERFPERGETFASFAARGPAHPDAQHRFIYLQAIGAWDPKTGADMSALREFTEAFFGVPTRLLDPVPVDAATFKARSREGGRRQLKTKSINDWLAGRMPADGFCIMGVTAEDLYPAEDWNFVYGETQPARKVGVFSFARHDPAFFGKPRGSGFQAMMRLLNFATLTHELGHIFGLVHCVFFHCGMNGALHQEEALENPIHLCPVCLRKLQHANGFDVVERYKRLAGLYEKHGLTAQRIWVQARLERILGGG